MAAATQRVGPKGPEGCHGSCRRQVGSAAVDASRRDEDGRLWLFGEALNEACSDSCRCHCLTQSTPKHQPLLQHGFAVRSLRRWTVRLRAQVKDLGTVTRQTSQCLCCCEALVPDRMWSAVLDASLGCDRGIFPTELCRRGDLNPHALTGTGTLSQRVCQFRHSDVATRETQMRRRSVARRRACATLQSRQRQRPWKEALEDQAVGD